MNAIPKALAMANPKHVVACVATVAGVISSKLAINAEARKLTDADFDMDKSFSDITDED